MPISQVQKLTACFSIAAGAGVAVAQPTGVTGYEVISIGVAPGDSVSSVKELDDLGRVVGESGSVFPTPYVWINGTLTVLPTPEGYERPRAGGIGSGGVVVGFATPLGFQYFHPITWTANDGMHRLNLLPGTTWGTARSVDDQAWPSSLSGGRCNGGADYATLWHGVSAMRIGDAASGVESVNNTGDAVGSAYNQQGVRRPVLWLANGQMIDIGGEPFDQHGGAGGINDVTEVVGSLQDTRRPFRWFNGNLTLLPRLYPCNSVGKAWAINNEGLIAGVDGPAGCATHDEATVWARLTTLEQTPAVYAAFDLNNHIPRHPDLTLLDAKDINDAGQMAAFGEYDDGRERGFLVTPYLFEMSDPSPGRAGQVNTITVTGLRPDQRVVLVWGLKEGAQKIKNDCPGGTLLIRDPHALPAVQADANGVATIIMQVPQMARGRTIRMQAIAPAECQISHTVTWVFE